MNIKIVTVLALSVAAPFFTLSSAGAEKHKTSWLFVQTAPTFDATGDMLTIPYEREVFAFTDRPNRQHAYLNATELTSFWNTGENNFGDNPPNAALTWVADGELREAEVMLSAAMVSDQGRSIAYQLQFEAGHTLPDKAQQVSLFIDGGTTEALEFICHINDGEFCRR